MNYLHHKQTDASVMCTQQWIKQITKKIIDISHCSSFQAITTSFIKQCVGLHRIYLPTCDPYPQPHLHQPTSSPVLLLPTNHPHIQWILNNSEMINMLNQHWNDPNSCQGEFCMIVVSKYLFQSYFSFFFLTLTDNALH